MNLIQPLLIEGYEDYEPILCANGSYTGSTYWEGERYTDRRLRGEPPLEPTREEWLKWQIEVLCAQGKGLLKAIDEELDKIATGKRRHYSEARMEKYRYAAMNLRYELEEIKDKLRAYRKELKTILQGGHYDFTDDDARREAKRGSKALSINAYVRTRMGEQQREENEAR